MDKVLEFIKNYFKGKTVLYYIALGAAIIAFLGGVIVSGALGFAGATAGPALLVTLGLVVFIASSVFGQDKIGTGAVAALSWAAFVETLCEVYAYYLNEISSQAMSGFDLGAIQGLGALITGIVMLILGALAANVFAFLKLSKQEKKEVKAEEVTDEN